MATYSINALGDPLRFYLPSSARYRLHATASSLNAIYGQQILLPLMLDAGYIAYSASSFNNYFFHAAYIA